MDSDKDSKESFFMRQFWTIFVLKILMGSSIFSSHFSFGQEICNTYANDLLKILTKQNSLLYQTKENDKTFDESYASIKAEHDQNLSKLALYRVLLGLKNQFNESVYDASVAAKEDSEETQNRLSNVIEGFEALIMALEAGRQAQAGQKIDASPEESENELFRKIKQSCLGICEDFSDYSMRAFSMVSSALNESEIVPEKIKEIIERTPQQLQASRETLQNLSETLGNNIKEQRKETLNQIKEFLRSIATGRESSDAMTATMDTYQDVEVNLAENDTLSLTRDLTTIYPQIINSTKMAIAIKEKRLEDQNLDNPTRKNLEEDISKHKKTLDDHNGYTDDLSNALREGKLPEFLMKQLGPLINCPDVLTKKTFNTCYGEWMESNPNTDLDKKMREIKDELKISKEKLKKLENSHNYKVLNECKKDLAILFNSQCSDSVEVKDAVKCEVSAEVDEFMMTPQKQILATLSNGVDLVIAELDDDQNLPSISWSEKERYQKNMEESCNKAMKINGKDPETYNQRAAATIASSSAKASRRERMINEYNRSRYWEYDRKWDPRTGQYRITGARRVQFGKTRGAMSTGEGFMRGLFSPFGGLAPATSTWLFTRPFLEEQNNYFVNAEIARKDYNAINNAWWDARCDALEAQGNFYQAGLQCIGYRPPEDAFWVSPPVNPGIGFDYSLQPFSYFPLMLGPSFTAK